MVYKLNEIATAEVDRRYQREDNDYVIESATNKKNIYIYIFVARGQSLCPSLVSIKKGILVDLPLWHQLQQLSSMRASSKAKQPQTFSDSKSINGE